MTHSQKKEGKDENEEKKDSGKLKRDQEEKNLQQPVLRGGRVWEGRKKKKRKKMFTGVKDTYSAADF